MSFICKMNDIIFGIVSLVLKTYVKHFNIKRAITKYVFEHQGAALDSHTINQK